MRELNKNPVVAVKLEAMVWLQAIKAIKVSPNAGNYLAAEAALAIEESLERAGVHPE